MTIQTVSPVLSVLIRVLACGVVPAALQAQMIATSVEAKLVAVQKESLQLEVQGKSIIVDATSKLIERVRSHEFSASASSRRVRVFLAAGDAGRLTAADLTFLPNEEPLKSLPRLTVNAEVASPNASSGEVASLLKQTLCAPPITKEYDPKWKEKLPSECVNKGRRGAEEWEQHLDAAIASVGDLYDARPQLICEQRVARYLRRGPRGIWRHVDDVLMDVAGTEGQERYTNIRVNGRPARIEDIQDLAGFRSYGELFSVLFSVLQGEAEFDSRVRREGDVIVLSFHVTEPYSSWELSANNVVLRPAYRGTLHFNERLKRLVKITKTVDRELPAAYPWSVAETEIEYDTILVGDQKYTLPKAARLAVCNRIDSICSRNEMVFIQYRRFDVSSLLVADSVPAPVQADAKRAELRKLFESMDYVRSMNAVLENVLTLTLPSSGMTQEEIQQARQVIRDKFPEMAEEAWSRSYTVAELQEINRFLSTPIGKKFAAAMPVVEINLNTVLAEMLPQYFRALKPR